MGLWTAYEWLSGTPESGSLVGEGIEPVVDGAVQ